MFLTCYKVPIAITFLALSSTPCNPCNTPLACRRRSPAIRVTRLAADAQSLTASRSIANASKRESSALTPAGALLGITLDSNVVRGVLFGPLKDLPKIQRSPSTPDHLTRKRSLESGSRYSSTGKAGDTKILTRGNS